MGPLILGFFINLLAIVTYLLHIQRLRRRIHQNNAERIRQANSLGRGNGIKEFTRFSDLPANDVYSNLKRDPLAFKDSCNFWPSEFDDLILEVADKVEQARAVRSGIEPDPHREGRPSQCKQDTNNRVLMVLEFLSSHNTYEQFASRYGVSTGVVSEDVRHIIAQMNDALEYELRWPTPAQIASLRRFGPGFEGAFGILDATCCQISIPSQQQQLHYRADKAYHFLSEQVITTCDGTFLHVSCGYHGNFHDGVVYHLSNVDSLLGPNDILLADGAYHGHEHLLVPFRSNQLRGNPARFLFNSLLRRRRVKVEHGIAFLKMKFAFAAERWRSFDHVLHSQAFLLAAKLCNRIRRIRQS